MGHGVSLPILLVVLYVGFVLLNTLIALSLVVHQHVAHLSVFFVSFACPKKGSLLCIAIV